MATDTPHSPRGNPRAAWLAAAALSLLAIIVAGVALAERIAAYNTAEAHPVYYFLSSDKTDFSFAGRPVIITDTLDGQGRGTVTVAYGPDTLTIPVAVPTALPLPGLDRHRDWLRLFVFAEGTGLTFDAFEKRIDTGQIPPRLALVTRRPNAAEPAREGPINRALAGENQEIDTPDEWGWNEVRRDKWVFTFDEFLPEGGFRHEEKRTPESGQSFYRRQVRAEREGLPPPTRDTSELEQHTWQFQAALHLMSRPPSITMERQALRNAGWTLPVASAGALGLLVSLAFAFAPRRSIEP